MKFFLGAVVMLLGCNIASGTTRYIAQTAGTFSGGTACNGHTAITPATWNATAESPGDVSYVCGNITFATNATGLTVGWSGISGNPITLLFDTGAVMQSPRFTVAITASGVSYVVIDGQNTGAIENTLSGSPNATCIGGPCSINQSGFAGTLIQFANGSNITIQNLSVLNSFVHAPVAGSGSDVSGGDVAAISICSGACGAGGGGSNILINHNTINNTGAGVFYTGNNGASNVTISNNTMADINTCYILGQGGGQNNYAFSGWYAFGNDCHDFANWNDCAGATNCGSYNHHHDGLGHIYLTATSQTLTNCYIYNNYIHGDFGHGTAQAYIETYNSSVSTCYVFNNVFAPTASTNGNAFGGFWAEAGSGTITTFVYNNTFTGAALGTFNDLWLEFTGISATWQNNIFYNSAAGIEFNAGAALPVASDYNIWSTFINGLAVDGRSYANLAAWQSGTGFDAHSSASSPNLNSSFVPNSGSPAIGLGTNLTSLCSGTLVALCSDKAGNARPSSGAWTAGAFNSGSSPSTVATPTFNPGAGTYPSAQSVTISTTTGGATLCYTTDGSTPTGNGAGTCTHGTTYSSSVSVSTSLTLQAIGTESGFTDSAVGSAAYIINSGPAPAPAMFVIATTAPCMISPFNTWTNIVIPSQSASFEIQFDVTPSAAGLDGVIGLAAGKASQDNNLAVPILFSNTGIIQAMNGSFPYPPGGVPYSANKEYHVTEDINTISHTYNAFIGTSSRTQIAKNYSFRSAAGVPASLGYLGLLQDLAQGSMAVCNITILNYPTPSATLKHGGKNI